MNNSERNNEDFFAKDEIFPSIKLKKIHKK